MKLTKALKKGVAIKVIAGKDKGKSGKVLRLDKKNFKVLVDGVNLYKKHKKPKKQGQKGEILTIPRPLDISNVRLEKDK
jgi:large subunit ribosomal protein L24